MTTLAISADGQAIALVCSTLALDGERALKPLSPAGWHELSLAIRAAAIRPRDLLGLAPDELRVALGIDAPMADRLAALLARGGQLALELERLSSRGIWIITRADDAYPPTLKDRLLGHAPPILFGAGPLAALRIAAIAIVGSRDVDEEGLRFASLLGRRCADQGLAVVSGAARGVDLAAMAGAISRGGSVVGVTVDPLERLVRRRELRAAIADEQLTLVTPFNPAARWHAGNAMRRNRLIYALAAAAVVVASSAARGGTRAGAIENLDAGWVPLHVRDDGSPGNGELIVRGAAPLPAYESPVTLDVHRLVTQPLASRDAPDATEPPGTELLAVAVAVEEPSPRVVPQPQASSPADAVDDLFAVVWPIIARHLYQPRGEREVADRMRLELKQARAWLNRAVAEGRAEIQPRPKRYVVRAVPVEQLRLDDL